jgi:hypothetical protein
MRLAIVVAKKHHRSRAFGWSVVAFQSTDYLGLFLMGSSSPPGPSGLGGEDRMPAVNDVGEPCARARHARFEVAGAETEQSWQPNKAAFGKPRGLSPELS